MKRLALATVIRYLRYSNSFRIGALTVLMVVAPLAAVMRLKHIDQPGAGMAEVWCCWRGAFDLIPLALWRYSEEEHHVRNGCCRFHRRKRRASKPSPMNSMVRTVDELGICHEQETCRGTGCSVKPPLNLLGLVDSHCIKLVIHLRIMSQSDRAESRFASDKISSDCCAPCNLAGTGWSISER